MKKIVPRKILQIFAVIDIKGGCPLKRVFITSCLAINEHRIEHKINVPQYIILLRRNVRLITAVMRGVREKSAASARCFFF